MESWAMPSALGSDPSSRGCLSLRGELRWGHPWPARVQPDQRRALMLATGAPFGLRGGVGSRACAPQYIHCLCFICALLLAHTHSCLMICRRRALMLWSWEGGKPPPCLGWGTQP